MNLYIISTFSKKLKIAKIRFLNFTNHEENFLLQPLHLFYEVILIFSFIKHQHFTKCYLFEHHH